MNENKLCLGTVQFGMNYGIKNELGRQPSKDESFAVLETAIAAGVSFFDTASAYGNAERLLGEFGIGNCKNYFKDVVRNERRCVRSHWCHRGITSATLR